jgi:hypothetical protein
MSEHKSVASFTPVPVRPRHDGWTAERQIAFIEKLADTNSISAACKYICFCAPGTAAAIPTHPTVRRAHAPARARPLRAQLWQLPSERRRRLPPPAGSQVRHSGGSRGLGQSYFFLAALLLLELDLLLPLLFEADFFAPPDFEAALAMLFSLSAPQNR